MSGTKGKNTNIHHDLIELCKLNNNKAQFELYRLYCSSIYNTCLRILKNSAKAEDAMQETFITAFGKLSLYKGEASFGAWLKRIAINKSIDELRKNNVQLENLDEPTIEFESLESSSIHSEDTNDTEYKIKVIKEAINLLPDGYRIVLSLHLFEGYDHEEIAQILGISESTSRSQYTRAKQKLVHLLHDNYGLRYE